MNSEFYVFFPSTAFSCNGKVRINKFKPLVQNGGEGGETYVAVYYILFAYVEPVVVNM